MLKKVKKAQTYIQTSVSMFGVTLPNKRVVIAFTYIYGIGLTNAKKICSACKIVEDRRLYSLTDEELDSVRKYISETFSIEGDLKLTVKTAISKYIHLRCYRGLRHLAGLPVRGQRTKTNARTRKGKVKRQIANKKKVAK